MSGGQFAGFKEGSVPTLQLALVKPLGGEWIGFEISTRSCAILCHLISTGSTFYLLEAKPWMWNCCNSKARALGGWWPTFQRSRINSEVVVTSCCRKNAVAILTFGENAKVIKRHVVGESRRICGVLRDKLQQQSRNKFIQRCKWRFCGEFPLTNITAMKWGYCVFLFTRVRRSCRSLDPLRRRCT